MSNNVLKSQSLKTEQQMSQCWGSTHTRAPQAASTKWSAYSTAYTTISTGAMEQKLTACV